VAAKAAWDLLVAGFVPRGAARCVVVSRAERRQHLAAGIPQARLVGVPNGLDLGEFDPLPPRGAFRRARGIPEDRPLVAYLGQVTPRKGVDHLVEAFRGDPPGGALLVVAGPDRQGLAGRAPGVRFTGVLEGRDRVALLRDTDVLVYASADEAFGLVPFEGLLSGAPVVVADDCGCGELVAEAGAGLLVRHGDVAALRERIATLLGDHALAAGMVERGRRWARANLGWPRIAALHEAVYAEVAAEGRR